MDTEPGVWFLSLQTQASATQDELENAWRDKDEAQKT